MDIVQSNCFSQPVPSLAKMGKGPSTVSQHHTNSCEQKAVEYHIQNITYIIFFIAPVKDT